MASAQMYGDATLQQINKLQQITSQQGVMQSPTREINPARLCRQGQEITHEIIQKTQEIFQFLKQTQVPNGVNMTVQMYQDRKSKLSQSIKAVSFYFTQLQVIYNKVNEATAHLDTSATEKLIPHKEGSDEYGLNLTESVKYSSPEHREVVQQLEAKNAQLKDIIDQIRTVIWDINTMMAMRRI